MPITACRRITVWILLLPLWIGGLAAEDGWGAWFLEGPATGSEGIDARRVLSDWPLVEPAEPVVVAVLDSGFDVDHPAFEGVVWHNSDEVGGEPGVDDDGNGFVDDRHGWSFLASSTGDDLEAARMEVTRELVRLEAALAAGEIAADDPYLRRVRNAYRQEEAQWRQRYQQIYAMNAVAERAREDLLEHGVDPLQPGALDGFAAETVPTQTAVAIWRQVNGQQVMRMFDQCEVAVEYWYDRDFDESAILGDDPGDPSSAGYGAPNLSVGDRDAHGTHVAGLIGARPFPGSDMRGVCPWVRLMFVRVVPEGDERDKDVANGVRYAVAEGAQVICMSFGKGYSPNKDWVDAAMAEAEAAGVLVVHGAGNDGANVEEQIFYPNPYRDDQLVDEQRFGNWLTVGASQRERRQLVAPYSNFGPRTVELLAPGSSVSGPHAGGGLDSGDGTSLSAPLVAGAAALLWSQYPEATVEQVRQAILDGVRRYPELVVQEPGSGRRVDLGDLCVSGGVLDVPGALRALDAIVGDGARWPKATED